ncbi:serine hydrolase [Telluribacter sp. SYSU D00476]|uniref:serine hydrolase domain-containing protein n=1 Tax=Telluribacter sp. SYSU D00476 TaxID=2811430 RepID=UPI001FF6F0BD|nr:serine hydrolase domain-containing protein [Telluribacter sp. SYSU D00476]
MKNVLMLLGLLCWFPAIGQSVGRQPNESIKDKSYLTAIRRAEKYIDSLRAVQDIPGISVCVGTSQKILWAEGFGYADLETHQPVTIHSKFRIGSVSKSLTSLAIGKLVEQKKLDLDAAIQQYVPQFPVKKYPVTARQLATHTAGIRHYRDSDPLACPRRFTSVQEGLTIFNQDSLLFKPGTAYNYSTYGYTLLSAVIEGASYQDYPSYMQQAVFTPLGMYDTGVDASDSIVINRVRFYEHRQGRLVNAAQVDNSYKWAGGGLLSTPVDLVKLGRGLLTYSLLRKETVDLLFTPQLLPDGTNTYYGLGWRLGTSPQNRKIIHHGGTIDGGRTFLLLYPEHDLVVAITANMSGVNINLPEVETIASYFFEVKR